MMTVVESYMAFAIVCCSGIHTWRRSSPPFTSSLVFTAQAAGLARRLSDSLKKLVIIEVYIKHK